MAKYQFVKRSNTNDDNLLRTTFVYWHTEYNRPYLLQVYLFKRTVYRTKNFNELHFVYDQQTEYLEFFQSARRSFPHILFIFRKLGLIDEEGVLNVEREFTTLHIREILKNDEG